MNDQAVRLIALGSAHEVFNWTAADGDSPFSLIADTCAGWCVWYKISRSIESSISFSIPLSIELAGELVNSAVDDI